MIEEDSLFACFKSRSDNGVGFFTRAAAATSTLSGRRFHSPSFIGHCFVRPSCPRLVNRSIDIEILAVFTDFAGSVEHIHTHISLTGTFSGERAVGYGFHVAGDSIHVGTIKNIGECGITRDGNQRVRVDSIVGVTTLERELARATVGRILTFAQSRHCGANLIEALNVACQRISEGGCEIACGIGILSKVSNL